MAEKTMVEAVRDAMFEEMKRDERVIVMGEDVGEGGVFRATEGFRDEFGREPLHGHAAGRGVHRRRGDRRVAQRHRADRRDPVRRLHPPGIRPDRERGGAAALPLERYVELPDHGPHAVRRRHPRWAVPLAEHRGVLRARARAEGDLRGHALRREGAAEVGDPRPEPGDLPRAQEGLPALPAGDPGRGLHDPDRRGGHQARRHGHHARHLRDDGAPLAEGRGDGAGGGRR